MKLLLFEFKKVMKAKVFLYFLLATVLFISIIFIYQIIQQDSIQAKKIDYYSSIARDVAQENYISRDRLKQGPDADAEAKLEIGQPFYSDLTYLLEVYNNNDWEEEIKAEIVVSKHALNWRLHYPNFRISEYELNKTIRLNEELLKRQLPKEDLDLSIQPTIFTKKIISIFLNFIGFIGLLLVLGTVVTREFEDKNMQLVFSLPISRGRYIGMKFISLIMLAFLWLAAVFTVSFLLPYLFGGKREDIFNYPLYTYDDVFINSGDYLVKAIVLSLSFTLFAISLIVFISYLVRNTIITFIVAILLFISGYVVSEYGFYFLINPFSYQSIDGSVLRFTEQYPVIHVILLLFAVVLVSLTIILNRKRGI